MPRTFVWHPTRGPKKAPRFNLPETGKVRIKQVRSGIGHEEAANAVLASELYRRFTGIEGQSGSN